MPEKITRTELYELIWSEPRFSIAKKFNVTDADLVKICKQLKVPVPRPGHWQRKKFNREAQPIALPADYSGEQEIILPSRPVGEIVESPVKILQRQIENDASVKLTVPKKLATLDKLILRAKAGLEERKKSGWTNNGLLNTRDELEINVSPQNIERALRFLDTLLKALYALPQ